MPYYTWELKRDPNLKNCPINMPKKPPPPDSDDPGPDTNPKPYTLYPKPLIEPSAPIAAKARSCACRLCRWPQHSVGLPKVCNYRVSMGFGFSLYAVDIGGYALNAKNPFRDQDFEFHWFFNGLGARSPADSTAPSPEKPIPP